MIIIQYCIIVTAWIKISISLTQSILIHNEKHINILLSQFLITKYETFNIQNIQNKLYP